MGSLIWAVVRPYVGYLIGAIAIAGLATGWIMKIKHDEKVRVLARVEREKEDAIKTATKARERVRKLCDATPLQCGPSDWYRD